MASESGRCAGGIDAAVELNLTVPVLAMIPTISQICSLNSPFEKDIEDYSAAQCQSIELWLGKLDGYLDSHSTADVKQLLDRHQVTAPVASFQGGLLASQGEKRRHAWELFEHRLKTCNSLAINTLVVACDVVGPLTSNDVQRTQVSLQQAAAAAEQKDVRIALEFQATATLGNNLQTAIALVEEVGSQHLGVCLDAFHFYLGPSKLADLALLTKDNLFHVQLSDLADVPRELASDSHRIMPGEGDIPIEAILAHLKRIGFEGCVSIETMNPQIWQVPALQFGEVAMTSLRKLLSDHPNREAP